MSDMELIFSNIGRSFGTRSKGAAIREQIESALNDSQIVIFDLEGVDVVSHCFADECFAKLLINRSIDSLKEQTTFVGTNDFVRKTIAYTFKQYLMEMMSKR